MRTIFWLLACVCFVACSQRQGDKAAPLRLQESLNIQQQIDFLNTVIETDNDNADYLFRRASLYLSAGKENLALRDTKAALDLDSTQGEFFFLKAQIHEAKKEYDEALKAAKNAEKRNFKHVQLGYMLGKASYFAGNYKESGGYFAQMQTLFPDNPELNYYRGLTYKAQKDTLNASKFLELALKQNPQYVEAHIALQELFYDLNDYKTALAKGQRALACCQKNAMVNYLYAQTLGKRFKEGESMEYYQKAVLIDSTLWQASYQLGVYHLWKKNYYLSQVYLKNTIRQNTKAEKADYYLAFLYEYHLKNPYLSLAHYQRAAVLNPNSTELVIAIQRTQKRVAWEEYKKTPEYALARLKKRQEEEANRTLSDSTATTQPTEPKR